MGQGSSRATPDSGRRLRDRVRPLSWAPSLSSPSPQPGSNGSNGSDSSDGMPELLTPHSGASVSTSVSAAAAASSRPVSQRLNPFNILSTHPGRSDAGTSGTSGAVTTLARRRSRISRTRSSFGSLPALFRRRSSSRPPNTASTYTSASDVSAPSAPPSALRHTASVGYERGTFLPRVQVPDLDINFDELSNSTSPESARLNAPRLLPARREGRTSSLIPHFRPDRGIRSMSSSLRRARRNNLHQRDEDQAAMLSRLLSVAAAATAASLMGDDHRAVSEARSVAGDGEDGTFDSFLQALQNGRIASALRQSGNDNDEGAEPTGGSPAPLNFFRMFRFGSAAPSRRSDTRSGSRSGDPPSSEQHDGDEDGDGRMVPIIIVGIRSINPGTTSPQDDNIPPFLDALSSFPTPLASPGDNAIDGMLQQPQQRFSHRRRASMGGVNTFPSNYDSQRHYRAPDRPRPWSTFTDSPAGPLPPPSTPASSGLSAVSSGANTPSTTTSPPSPIVQSSVPSRRESLVRRTTGPGLEPTAEEPHAQPRIPRQRRMSESDFTRFGSGASRRNGVVEPDHNPGEGSRSWIIYVLGGSYPENHPILTTPSLFTDSPTYEDMLLLSTLLGPAKPPVASEEDVASAPGLFRIREHEGTLVAEAVEGGEVVSLATDQRCLVCLCDFELDEEARKLVKCGHLFHKICIDQWLTTGRNSCPLCRGQGVDEKAEGSQPTTPQGAPGRSVLPQFT